MCDQAPPGCQKKTSCSQKPPSCAQQQSSCSQQKHQQPKRVGIVGCGFTGTSAFYQLISDYPVEEIFIFEQSGNFGPGYAWQPSERSDYLVNNTTGTLCLTPTNLKAFYNWLTNCQNEQVDENGHQSRSRFGEFLQDVIHTSKTISAIKGIKVNFISKEVVDIWEEGNVCHILGKDEKDVVVDAVLIATGRCPYKENFSSLSSFPSSPSSLSSPSPIYIPDHVNISKDTFDSLPLSSTIHVLGASLSAFDVVNALYSPSSSCQFVRDPETGKLKFIPGDNDRKVVLCSRSGRLKKVGAGGAPAMKVKRQFFTEENVERLYKEGGGLTLEEVAGLFKQDVEENMKEMKEGSVDFGEILEPYKGCGSVEEVTERAKGILEGDVQRAKGGGNVVFDVLNSGVFVGLKLIEEGWLKPEEEKRYREEWETMVLSYFASAPVLTGERLLALFEAGRVKIIQGVNKVTSDSTHCTISHAFGEEKATYVINTTGAVDRDVYSPHQPLFIQKMVERGSLKSHTRCNGKEKGGMKLKGAGIEMKSMRVKGGKNVYMVNMLTWGPAFFSSSALLMAYYVQRALKDMYGE